MPLTKYELTADTSHDIDIIEWLDSFSAEEQQFAMRTSLRFYMQQMEIEEMSSPQNVMERINKLEETLAEILRQVVDIRKSGVVVTTKQQNPEKSNIDDYDISEADKNLSSMFD